MKRLEAFPSNYMSKDDLDHPTILTIDHVAQEEMESDGQTQHKPVVFWRERNAKKWIINLGNFMALEDTYGADTDDWTGKPVELFVDPSVMFAGKRVGGVRVRIPSGTSPSQVSGPQTQITAVTISGVQVKDGWYGIRTDKGVFVTRDASLGGTIQSFGNIKASFIYKIDPNGKQFVVEAAPAAPADETMADDSDIPF